MSLGAVGMQLAAQAASMHIFPQGSTYHCCSLLADPGCSPLPALLLLLPIKHVCAPLLAVVAADVSGACALQEAASNCSEEQLSAFLKECSVTIIPVWAAAS